MKYQRVCRPAVSARAGPAGPAIAALAPLTAGWDIENAGVGIPEPTGRTCAVSSRAARTAIATFAAGSTGSRRHFAGVEGDLTCPAQDRYRSAAACTAATGVASTTAGATG